MLFFKTGGKVYEQLGIYGGVIYLGNPLDPNRGVVKSGVIWEMQPFYYHEEISFIAKTYYYILRYFMKDRYGRSPFKENI